VSDKVKHGVIMMPTISWECETCGRTNDSGMSFCPCCKGGHLEDGGLLNGGRPYFPEWHVRKAGFKHI